MPDIRNHRKKEKKQHDEGRQHQSVAEVFVSQQQAGKGKHGAERIIKPL